MYQMISVISTVCINIEVDIAMDFLICKHYKSTNCYFRLYMCRLTQSGYINIISTLIILTPQSILCIQLQRYSDMCISNYVVLLMLLDWQVVPIHIKEE